MLEAVEEALGDDIGVVLGLQEYHAGPWLLLGRRCQSVGMRGCVRGDSPWQCGCRMFSGFQASDCDLRFEESSGLCPNLYFVLGPGIAERVTGQGQASQLIAIIAG